MSGRELVDRLERDFQRTEEPFSVTFESVEQARSLLFGLCGDYTASLPTWRELRIGAMLRIATAVNDDDHRSEGRA